MDINIFTQIGFVVLVGLACKNAILIVEFAKAQREAGSDRYEATLEACQLRLRPIIMTSFAFILGVVPLVLAEGAGAEMRRTLGTAVFGGMLGVTLFGIFLTPVSTTSSSGSTTCGGAASRIRRDGLSHLLKSVPRPHVLKRSPAAKRPPRPHHLGEKPPSSDVRSTWNSSTRRPLRGREPAPRSNPRCRHGSPVSRGGSVVHEQPAQIGVQEAALRIDSASHGLKLQPIAVTACCKSRLARSCILPSAGPPPCRRKILSASAKNTSSGSSAPRWIEMATVARPFAPLSGISSAACVRYSTGQDIDVCLCRMRSAQASRKHSTPRRAATENSISLKRFARTVGKIFQLRSTRSPSALASVTPSVRMSPASSAVNGRLVGLSVLSLRSRRPGTRRIQNGVARSAVRGPRGNPRWARGGLVRAVDQGVAVSGARP